MMYWAFIFLTIAVIAAIFGFGIAAPAAASMGKILFLLFTGGFIVTVALSVSNRSNAN
jgi:uncharacterized membrane protein YtjA (UPF0391 family)